VGEVTEPSNVDAVVESTVAWSGTIIRIMRLATAAADKRIVLPSSTTLVIGAALEAAVEETSAAAESAGDALSLPG